MRFGPLLLVLAATAAQLDDPEAYNHIAHAILYRNLSRAGALKTEPTRPLRSQAAADT